MFLSRSVASDKVLEGPGAFQVFFGSKTLDTFVPHVDELTGQVHSHIQCSPGSCGQCPRKTWPRKTWRRSLSILWTALIVSL